ncbi:hypothetical protein Hdeb2414_s0001g00036991 [Helianthus debilis subsp. tardiflorus]
MVQGRSGDFPRRHRRKGVSCGVPRRGQLPPQLPDHQPAPTPRRLKVSMAEGYLHIFLPIISTPTNMGSALSSVEK